MYAYIHCVHNHVCPIHLNSSLWHGSAVSHGCPNATRRVIIRWNVWRSWGGCGDKLWSKLWSQSQQAQIIQNRKFKKLIYNPTKAKLSQCCLPSTIPASLLLATSKPANNLIFHLHISLLWPQGAGPAFLKSLAASPSLLTMFGFRFHHIYLHSALYVCI